MPNFVREGYATPQAGAYHDIKGSGALAAGELLHDIANTAVLRRIRDHGDDIRRILIAQTIDLGDTAIPQVDQVVGRIGQIFAVRDFGDLHQVYAPINIAVFI